MLKAKDTDGGVLGYEKLRSKSPKPQLGLASSKIDRKGYARIIYHRQ